MCFCDSNCRSMFCDSDVCQTELKRIGGYGRVDIQDIIRQTDKKHLASVIKEYFDNKEDMLELMRALAASENTKVTLTVERDGAVELSWKENDIDFINFINLR